MNKDEIKKALVNCLNGVSCESCPYYNGLSKPCIDAVSKDAFELITEQENEIDLLQMQMKDVVNHADTFLAEANKFEAENKKLKAENKMRLINLHTALDDIKQAKIEALNELRGRADLAGIMVVTVSDIDEMIEELKK